MSFTETKIFTKSICVDLNASSGSTILPIIPPGDILEYGFDSVLYSVRFLGRRLLELSAIAKIASLSESNPPETAGLTDTETALAMREWAFANPRKQIDFFVKQDPTGWLFRGSLSLLRINPYLDQAVVGNIFYEASNFSDRLEIGVKQVDVGSGLLIGDDKLTLIGSYSELVEITKKATWIVGTPTPTPTPTPPTPTPTPTPTPPTPTPTPTPTPPTPLYEPEAIAYFDALATVGSELADNYKSAIDGFIFALKTDGYWNRIEVCNFLLGGTLNAARISLKGNNLTFMGFTDAHLTYQGIVSNGNGYLSVANDGVTPETGVSIQTTYFNQTNEAYLSAALGDSAGIAQFGAYAVIYLGVGGAANGSLSGYGKYWLIGGAGATTSKAYRENTEVGSLFTGGGWLTPNPSNYYFLGSPSQPKANGPILANVLIFNSALTAVEVSEVNSILQPLVETLGKSFEY